MRQHPTRRVASPPPARTRYPSSSPHLLLVLATHHLLLDNPLPYRLVRPHRRERRPLLAAGEEIRLLAVQGSSQGACQGRLPLLVVGERLDGRQVAEGTRRRVRCLRRGALDEPSGSSASASAVAAAAGRGSSRTRQRHAARPRNRLLRGGKRGRDGRERRAPRGHGEGCGPTLAPGGEVEARAAGSTGGILLLPGRGGERRVGWGWAVEVGLVVNVPVRRCVVRRRQGRRRWSRRRMRGVVWSKPGRRGVQGDGCERDRRLARGRKRRHREGRGEVQGRWRPLSLREDTRAERGGRHWP